MKSVSEVQNCEYKTFRDTSHTHAADFPTCRKSLKLNSMRSLMVEIED